MVKVLVKRSKIMGDILCPPSKSYTHRAIVISSLAPGTTNLENVLFSRDTIATMNCCKMLGVEIDNTSHDLPLSYQNKSFLPDDTPNFTEDGYPGKEASLCSSGKLRITSAGGRVGYKTPDNILDCQNSGTTIRLLTSVCSLVKDGYSVLTGDNSLIKRPMRDLLVSLNQLGVKCFSANVEDTPPLIVGGGGMKGGDISTSGTISSQFVSSLLLSSPYAQSPVRIRVLGKQVSKPYIISTISVMGRFGIEVTNEPVEFKEANGERDGQEFVTEVYDIPNQKNYLSTNFKIPGDFSTAALLMSSAILTEGEITIHNLDFSMPQGDMEIINILKIMGASITQDPLKGTLKVVGTNALDGGLDLDLRGTPDLLPVVGIVALKCSKQTRITGIAHARYKETDRVSIIASELRRFGADVVEKHDSLTIKPPSRIKNATVNSFDDHRL
ncbi:MAG: 3-phosphoshikimate 1-carboxyvinyltransferase, partial [Thermoproteota archaeon]|nr:3-phosphoshikimate 1-carboxyvinyltransferase [Thermoproteota archaeon]